MFCSECGSNNQDNAIKCSSCGCAFEGVSSPELKPVYQPSSQRSSHDEYKDAPFLTTLLGSSEYSVVRAKWFYTKAEKIINIACWIALIGMVIALGFTFFLSTGLGFAQLMLDVGLVIMLFIAIVFSKLMLVAIGSLIRMTEIMEDRQK
ncbi:hypothetical protein G6712_06125 [Polynucleobacter paneuropaeus]|nr:hypothetical protein [Polynucleobacter paneuropaeus]